MFISSITVLELETGAFLLLRRDARQGKVIQRWIEDPLSEKILLGEFSRGDELEVDVSPDGSKLDFRVLTATSNNA